MIYTLKINSNIITHNVYYISINKNKFKKIKFIKKYKISNLLLKSCKIFLTKFFQFQANNFELSHRHVATFGKFKINYPLCVLRMKPHKNIFGISKLKKITNHVIAKNSETMLFIKNNLTYPVSIKYIDRDYITLSFYCKNDLILFKLKYSKFIKNYP